MAHVVLTADSYSFRGVLEEERAPRTCAAFRSLLPLKAKLVHARWSGEAVWVPLGGLDLGLEHEAATTYPAPGQVLLFPGGISETELLIPYGGAAFGSIAGPLAGNHLLTFEDPAPLRELGERILWNGATDVSFELLDA